MEIKLISFYCKGSLFKHTGTIEKEKYFYAVAHMGVLATSHSDIKQCLFSHKSCRLCWYFVVFLYVQILLAN